MKNVIFPNFGPLNFNVKYFNFFKVFVVKKINSWFRNKNNRKSPRKSK